MMMMMMMIANRYTLIKGVHAQLYRGTRAPTSGEAGKSSTFKVELKTVRIHKKTLRDVQAIRTQLQQQYRI